MRRATFDLITSAVGLMTTGAQAKTYADHFIAVHLNEIGGGKTYSQLSAESLAQPGNAVLKAQADTVFKGTTLRGLLLNAYAFWHRRRTPAEAQLNA